MEPVKCYKIDIEQVWIEDDGTFLRYILIFFKQSLKTK